MLLTIVTMLYLRSPEIIHLITKSLYILTIIFPFPIPLTPANHHCTFCLFKFYFLLNYFYYPHLHFDMTIWFILSNGVWVEMMCAISIRPYNNLPLKKFFWLFSQFMAECIELWKPRVECIYRVDGFWGGSK